MGAVGLPPGLLRAIEGLRRSFLWNVTGTTGGAKCLVACSDVCRPKEEGGLGIRKLSDKNDCLQLKLVHRLHADPSAPWPRWAWATAIGGRAVGLHWQSLVALMPMYRSLTRVCVGDGCRIAFWLDSWLGTLPLCCQFPALFSHALYPGATVQSVVGANLRRALVPRLTSAGERDLAVLHGLLEGFHLSPAPDCRVLLRCRKPCGALDAAALYKLRTWGGVDAPFFAFVWRNFAPSKVKNFAWLLSRDRI
jgi:hypothetical protein